ncbi:MAG: hypothetical protein L0G89_00290 [Janibacter sp.]|nr:hypothetical protein [Janibacter sp.]
MRSIGWTLALTLARECDISAKPHPLLEELDVSAGDILPVVRLHPTDRGGVIEGAPGRVEDLVDRRMHRDCHDAIMPSVHGIAR